ncbi:MAG: hypothetical protein IPI68_11590 [Chitinophagaceae bacterium]|nr:hypothetical protein [Chitinophagaceae bacterium]
MEVVISGSGLPPYQSVISMVGGSIDLTKDLLLLKQNYPPDPMLKPNQTATMKILDCKARGRCRSGKCGTE